MLIAIAIKNDDYFLNQNNRDNTFGFRFRLSF